MIKKILIVDDSPVSIKILKSCIPKNRGYEFFDAADGRQGVEAFLQVRPELTFMDLTMPVMNGFDALEEIIGIDRLAVVVIATADVQVKAITRAHDLGAFAVVRKPPTKGKIAAVIGEVEAALRERG
jgi:two-component system chemotaxis response regulator CheY